MKIYRQTEGQTDRQKGGRTDGRQAIRKAQLNFRLRWVKRHCYENRYIEWYYRQATGVLIKTKLSSNLAEVAYIWNECKIFNVTLFRIVLICFFYTKGKMFFLFIYINIEGMVGAKIKILWSTDKIKQCIYTENDIITNYINWFNTIISRMYLLLLLIVINNFLNRRATGFNAYPCFKDSTCSSFPKNILISPELCSAVQKKILQDIMDFLHMQ